jgi:hypothetical protein
MANRAQPSLIARTKVPLRGARILNYAALGFRPRFEAIRVMAGEGLPVQLAVRALHAARNFAPYPA